MFTILIVEDNATFRQTLRGLLGERFPGIAIEEAENGGQALQKVETLLPDVIFMDIKMPGENGLELTRKIKTSYPDIIVIFLTSYDLPEYREAAHRIGANHFLSKGATTAEEILGLVNAIVSDSRKGGSP